MASNHIPLRAGPGRGNMHGSGEDEWQEESPFPFMNGAYSHMLPTPSDADFAPFTPYHHPVYGGVSESYSNQSGLPYSFPFVPSDTSVGGETYYSNTPHSPLANEYFPPQHRPSQPSGSNPPRIQPRPVSFSSSTPRPPEPSNEPARQPLESTITNQPAPVSGTGRRGRGGPLEEQARHEAARNRADGCCLFHVTRKTKCLRPATPESSSVCGSCKLTNRICYRLSQKRKEALFIGRPLLSNSETQQPLLALAGTTALTKLLRFTIQVKYQGQAPLPFVVDQSPPATRASSGTNLEQSVLGSIGDKPFHELLESMAAQAQITERLKELAKVDCDHSAEKQPLVSCPIKDLLISVRKCVLIYLLLRRLPDAQLRTQGTDHHAAKCFIISLTNRGICEMRASLGNSIELLAKVIQSHRKVYSEPSYDRVVTAQVAFCGLVRVIALRQNVKAGDNIMDDAISGLLPAAQPFSQELERLGQGFCAITDPVPPTEEFREKAETALTLGPIARLLIVLEPSGSESSLHEEGAVSRQSMQSMPLWSAARDPHSRNRSFHGQPVRLLFTSNRLTADERRVRRGSARTSPSASDSDNDGSWDLLSDKQSKSPTSAGPSSGPHPPARSYKRERSDSMRASVAHSEKKAKSP